MKKFILFAVVFFLSSTFVAPVSYAKLTKDERQKKAVERWCNEKWFKNKNYFDIYENKIEVVGIEKIKIGKLKKRWTCHWRQLPQPPLFHYEYWWSKKDPFVKEPYRTLEHHYDAAGNYTDNSYADIWIQVDKITKEEERCQNFHNPETIYSGKAPVVSEICSPF